MEPSQLIEKMTRDILLSDKIPLIQKLIAIEHAFPPRDYLQLLRIQKNNETIEEMDKALNIFPCFKEAVEVYLRDGNLEELFPEPKRDYDYGRAIYNKVINETLNKMEMGEEFDSEYRERLQIKRGW